MPSPTPPAPPVVPPALTQSAGGPLLHAALLRSADVRVTRSHRHARGQLFGALAGLLSVDAAHHRWVVPATHAVWIPPDVAHAMRSHGPFSGWAVYVAPDACAGLPDAPCIVSMSPLLRAAVERAASWNDVPPDARHGAPRDAARERIAGVIVDEIRGAAREPLGVPLPRDARLARIARALADEPADNRTLDEWARWAGVSPRTMSRRFVAETGLSFTVWRQRIRAMRALEMLAAGAPVTRVALDLGYDNVSAFIVMFRRCFGVTPARYFA
ncbi:AraC family transcriptional regulator [Burkholderia thailandensis]|uniref:AraC family transcriptional regulator n=1 Tax=Burkholderia thailandensis TaxID=57975 RepID=UPI00235FB012|nr:helix-turn-helix transcriptional regulator [Burkholderia thailandensis]MDD1483884.1 helix-turn-helix transcriptional regulator [Burkholderia thailandensis]MDD1490148.1 helix-turn-helix transcriptional regulator [Burkholderia thailandensis]MDD1496076.1 helix-turn-helix transcriptional regulator [Burkholderia thailandensis]